MDNYYIAAGMNSAGVVNAGGIGKLLSEWIVHGEPSLDMWMMDARRFVPLHNNRKFLRDRVKETLGDVFLSLVMENFRTKSGIDIVVKTYINQNLGSILF